MISETREKNRIVFIIFIIDMSRVGIGAPAPFVSGEIE
jgi:hypothetical protein